MPSHRAVHVIEANGSSPDRARAQLHQRMRIAAELERKAREEVDRLSLIADEMGWTLAQIATAVGISTEAARQRQRRTWKRVR